MQQNATFKRVYLKAEAKGLLIRVYIIEVFGIY